MENLVAMSNVFGRQRNKTLFIVEGDREALLLKDLVFYFPSLNIEPNNIVIYHSNIYDLNNKIIQEYGDHWDNEDIDLPFVIGKHLGKTYWAEDFTNIFILFDYERQDTFFSPDTIIRFQNYFLDSTSYGQLYINYPMVESFEHFLGVPDAGYYGRYVKLAEIKNYKLTVKSEGKVIKCLSSKERLSKILPGKEEEKEQKIKEILDKPQKTFFDDDLANEYITSLQEGLVFRSPQKEKQFPFEFKALIRELYLELGETDTLFDHNKRIYQEIALHCIRKAYGIQSEFSFEEADLCGKERENFSHVDYTKILSEQNSASQRAEGVVWVLNTAVLLVPNYRFSLLE